MEKPGGSLIDASGKAWLTSVMAGTLVSFTPGIKSAVATVGEFVQPNSNAVAKSVTTKTERIIRILVEGAKLDPKAF
jgi:hypothetical protein